MPLLLAWQMGAKTMAKISKEEWEQGTQTLECVSCNSYQFGRSLLTVCVRISSLPLLQLALQDLNDLLISDKPPVLSKTAASGAYSSLKQIPQVQIVPSDPYQRKQYYSYAKDKKAGFSKLYTFCFALAKPEYVLGSLSSGFDDLTARYRSSRNLDMEVSRSSHLICIASLFMRLLQTSQAFWSVLLQPKFPIIEDLIEFINVSSLIFCNCIPVFMIICRRKAHIKASTKICGT